MGQERRQHPRLAKPLDGTWRGASGGSPCRIADISWGGCFIQTLAEPSIGEHTVVCVPVADRTLEIAGTIVYRERAIGFAVRFDPLTADQTAALKPLLGEPPAG